MATNSIKLLTGNSHPQLAKLVADRWVLLNSSMQFRGIGDARPFLGDILADLMLNRHWVIEMDDRLRAIRDGKTAG
jgi:hypothetical protein